jgi:hypothetical protein
MKWLLLFVVLVALVGVVSADTLIVYTTNSTDGYLSRQSHNVTFTDLRNGAGTVSYFVSTSNPARLTSDVETNSFYQIFRTVTIFDTSSLPDDATISTASIGLYSSGGSTPLGDTGVNIVKFNIDGTLTTDDYDNFDYTEYSEYRNVSTILGGTSYYNWAFGSLGIQNISKTSNSGFGTLLEWDITNTSPTWISGKTTAFYAYMAEDVTRPPFLEITYTVPDTTPPASITGLANTSVSCNQLFFNWTNPADADYAGMMLYRNNTQLANLTASDTGVSWDGLPGGTAITFSSRTFDTEGNVNATWVNTTTITESCGAPTPTPTPVPFQSHFTVSPSCGNVPFTATFTDTSTGENITVWSWDFGDGNTSILEDDTNLYSSEGLYTVRHSIDDGLGNISWSNKTGAIRATPEWYECSRSTGGVMVANDLPIPAIIPVISFGLALLVWRRKSRM